MNSAKDLVDKHFARALSEVATKKMSSPPQAEEKQPGTLQKNRGNLANTRTSTSCNFLLVVAIIPFLQSLTRYIEASLHLNTCVAAYQLLYMI